MVRIRLSGPITTPEPLRVAPSVSADRAPGAADTCTPTTAALALVRAWMVASCCEVDGVAARAGCQAAMPTNKANPDKTTARRAATKEMKGGETRVRGM